MENQIVADIEQEMLKYLNNHQMEQLHKTLTHYLHGMVAAASPSQATEHESAQNDDLLLKFIAAKRVEGCSARSLRYYESTLKNMVSGLD